MRMDSLPVLLSYEMETKSKRKSLMKLKESLIRYIQYYYDPKSVIIYKQPYANRTPHRTEDAC